MRYRPRNDIIMVHMFVFGHDAPRLTAVRLRVASLFKVVQQCGSNVKNTKQISWQARAGSLAKKVKLQNKDPDRLQNVENAKQSCGYARATRG